MSSLKMTFSLTSLIFLIALGLVVAPMSVMAHSVADIGTLASHGHPTDAIPADSNASPPTTLVSEHGEHPSVVSITAVATTPATADNVKKVGDTTYIALDSDTETANIPDTVDLIVEFDQAVNGGTTALATATAIVAGDVLDSTGFEFVVVDEDEFTDGNAFGSNADQITFGTSTRFSSGTPVVVDNKKFVIPLTFGADLIPTATEPQRELIFRIRAKADAAKGLRKAYANNTKLHDGAPSASSKPYSFTLVNALPSDPDTTAPTATITAGTLQADGTVDFTIEFSEPVTGFGLSDITVVNGDKTDFEDETSSKYILTVTPEADKKVTVKISAGAVKDAADNTNAATDASYTPTGYVPTITVTAAAGTGDDDDKVIFTLNFSDVPAAFSVASLNVTGANALKVKDLMKASTADAGYAATYTLQTTPKKDAKKVTLSIGAGTLQTDDTPPLFFEGVSVEHEITSDEPQPASSENTLTGLSVAAESFIVIVRD